MKKILLSTLLFIGVMTFSGCAKKQESEVHTNQNEDALQEEVQNSSMMENG